MRSGVDAKRVIAEEVKERVRKSVEVLRKEYEEAVRMNDALPVEVLYCTVLYCTALHCIVRVRVSKCSIT